MEHDFYKLDEAAKRLVCGTNELLKLGATGKIELCTWYSGRINEDPVWESMYKHIERTSGNGRPWIQGEIVSKIMPLKEDDIMELYIGDQPNSGKPGQVNVYMLNWPGFGNVWLADRIVALTADGLVITNETFKALNLARELEIDVEAPPESKSSSQAVQLSVKEFAEKLRDRNEDEKVILALAKREYPHMTAGAIAKELIYASHLKYKSQRRTTLRDIRQGEKILDRREQSK